MNGLTGPKKIVLIAAVTVLLTVTVLANLSGLRKDAERTRLQEGAQSDWFASDFSLETLDGQPFTHAELNRSRITVINGWGLYCSACLRELPALQALSEEYDPADVQIVTVLADYMALAYDRAMTDAVRSLLCEKAIDLPVMLADDGFTGQVFPMLHDSLPGTWIVDNRGQQLFFVMGSRTQEEWKDICDRCLALY